MLAITLVMECIFPRVSAFAGMHRSVTFPQRTVIQSSEYYAFSVFGADVNEDGKPDILYSSYTSNSVGRYLSNGNGTFAGSSPVNNSPADGAWSVCAGDLTNDGRRDVVVACAASGEIKWYQNSGAGTFTSHGVTTAVSFPTSVAVADLNEDGYLDIISASVSDNKVAWYRNLAGGSFNAQQIISTAAYCPQAVCAADLDGDGKPDVISASDNDAIAWYRNLGGGDFGSRPANFRVIASNVGNVTSVTSADLDGDGKLDVVFASVYPGSVGWCRNLGNGTFAAPVNLAQGNGARSVFVADIDADGKPDVLMVFSTSRTVGCVRNLGNGAFSPLQVISNAASEVYSVYAADFAGNGTLGVVSSSVSDVAFYPIVLGGNFALATSSTAPASVLEGQRRDVLRVDLTHKGLSGDDDVILKSMTLLFEKAAGSPLTTAEASNLIRSVSIYADSAGTGTFDSTQDSLIFTQTSLALNNGKLVLDLSSASPNDFRASYGTPRTLFVVVELTQNASIQSPNSFRITNVTDQTGAFTGIDAQAGAPLLAESSQSISTPFISIAANKVVLTAHPVGSSVSVLDISSGFLSSLFSTSPSLTGSSAATAKPGISSLASVNSTNGTLGSNSTATVGGSSQITVAATDAAGTTATAAPQVAANPITTISDWRANRYGSSLITKAGDQLNYAFALSPSGADGPSMRIENGLPVFSHRKPKYATDLSYSYEISQDLVHWIPAVKGVHFISYTRPLNDGTASEICVVLVKWKSVFMRAGAQFITPAFMSSPGTSGSSTTTSSSAN